mgnify:CR=1 FL=1
MKNNIRSIKYHIQQELYHIATTHCIALEAAYKNKVVDIMKNILLDDREIKNKKKLDSRLKKVIYVSVEIE